MKTLSLVVALNCVAAFASASGFVKKEAKSLVTCQDVDSAISAAHYHKMTEKAYMAMLEKRHAELKCGKDLECPALDKQMASEADGWGRKMHASRRLRLGCPGAEPAIPSK